MSQDILGFLVILFTFILLAILYFAIFPKSTSSQADAQIIAAQQAQQNDKEDKNWNYFRELEGYFKRYLDANIGQNRFIFVLTLVFIFGGFVMIGYGIFAQQTSTEATQQPWPAILAGLVTEFIAATILIVYQSISRQTENYFNTLERIMRIGAALRVLDDLKKDAQNEPLLRAKSTVIELLLTLQEGKTQTGHPADKPTHQNRSE
jgi:hypothetical protein